MMAVPQLAVPAEPPAMAAIGSAESPICNSTSSTPTSKASAAIWLSAVQAPYASRWPLSHGPGVNASLKLPTHSPRCAAFTPDPR